MKRTEENEQIALFEWAAWAEKQIPALRWLYHVPNGGARHKAVAAKLKAAGVKRGVPDLCLAVPSGGYHGMYIELKVGKNKPTQMQQEWIAHMQNVGYCAVVCYGADEAICAIKRYLGA